MSLPKRIQLKRRKGWRIPANTVIVDRRNRRWGNPHRVGVDGTAMECVNKYITDLMPYSHHGKSTADSMHDFLLSSANLEAIQIELRGKNIGCWCSLCEKHQDGLPYGEKCTDCAPCHGNFLLDIANMPE